MVSALPIVCYSKIYKLLRNLVIHATAAIEETQIEVYVQNSDIFIDVISITIKYLQHTIKDSQMVPYHIINLLVQLVQKLNQKSKLIMIDLPIPRFLNLF